ncbi:MAG TPA: hypothetical protein VFY13_02845 [Luteolibacter sp.]|nr:hypothetical protein [Luteolibacter sp.]
MSRIDHLLFFLLACLLILPASAEEEAVPTRTIRILFLNAPQNAPTTAHLHDGTASREVQLPSMNLSPIYEVPAGLLNLRLLAQAVEDPKQIPDKAPAALIPETMGDAYLLCISDPDNPIVPVRVEVVDAGKNTFRDGQMIWCNLTPFEITGTLGNEKLKITPQERVIMNAPLDESGSYLVSISYTIQGNEQVHPISETRWMHDPNTRQLVFVFTEAGRRLPRIQSFADFRPQSEKKPADKP